VPATPIGTSRPAIAAGAVDYRIVDDAEDNIMLYQFFSGAFTNRSDIFVAHIYAAGYERGGYDRGVAESARAIVVIDRSNLRTGQDSARILAVYRY